MKKQPKQSVREKFQFHQTPCEGKVAGLYVRVSSDEFVRNEAGEKERRQSVQSQIKDLQSRAEKEGWKWRLYDQDCDLSGSIEAASRPDMARLTADILKGEIHTVIFRELKRVFRNQREQAKWINDVLIPNGVRPVSLTESIDIESWQGKMMLDISGHINQQELAYIAQRSVYEKNQKAQQGTLRCTPTYGYGIVETEGVRRCVVKDAEAAIVKEIFRRAASGESARSIHRDLSARGIRASRGGRLVETNVVRWIANPVYHGAIIWQGTEYKSPYPAIVDEKTWSDAQTTIARRREKWGHTRRQASNGHLLTGVAKCGYCFDMADDNDAVIKIHPNMCVSYNNQKSYTNYSCQTRTKHKKQACPQSISVSEKYLDAVVRAVAGELAAGTYAASVAKMASSTTAQANLAETLMAQAAKAKARAQRATALYAKGDIDEDTMVAIVKAAKAEAAKLEAQSKEAASKPSNDALAVQGALSGLALWDTMPMDAKRRTIGDIFEHILVYADRLVLRVALCQSDIVLPMVKTSGRRRVAIGIPSEIDGREITVDPVDTPSAVRWLIAEAVLTNPPQD